LAVEVRAARNLGTTCMDIDDESKALVA
jgi:hypothetical protein